MDVPLWLELVGLVVLLGLSAFFSSSETSLFSLDRVQLAQMARQNLPRIELIERLRGQPRRLIVTILIGNELVNVAASVLSAGIIIQFLGAEMKWVNILVMVPILLLFGEITPKSLAIRHNVAFATAQCALIDRFAQLIAPVRWIVRRVSDFFITLIVGEERTAASITTEDVVRTLATEALGKGALDDREAQYIHQIFDFGDTVVRDILMPRSQIFMLPVDMPLAEIAAEVRRTRHTKVPVHAHDDKDTILGILFARDLLALELHGKDGGDDRKTLAKILRKAYFVPETRTASDLFLSFRRRSLSLALTVDEYGGVTGLVTMEDLLECIFGEIESGSEYRRRQQITFEDLGGGRYRVDASMTVHQFNELLGCTLADDSAETIGGILLNQFGEMPQEGSTTRVENLEFTVVSIAGHRMEEVTVQPSPEEPAPAEAAEPSEPDDPTEDGGLDETPPEDDGPDEDGGSDETPPDSPSEAEKV